MPSHVKAAAPRVKGKMTFEAQNKAPVASGSTPQRKRPAPPSDDEDEEDDDDNDEADVESEPDTDDEIATAQAGKSKKTAKRKRRATSPSTFGAAMEGLLGKANEEGQDEAGRSIQNSMPPKKGQSTILSLAPHIRRSAQSSRLNDKASRLATEAKKKREERARVTDVIGGWGAPGQPPKTVEGNEKVQEDVNDDDDDESEHLKDWRLQGGAQGYERRLKKVAQRGVVKLFNAIRAAQNTTEEDVDQVKGSKKEENASKPAASNSIKGENALGAKGRAVHELSKNNFFDLIRGGAKAAAH